MAFDSRKRARSEEKATEPSLFQLKNDVRNLDRQTLVDIVLELATIPPENFLADSPFNIIFHSVQNCVAHKEQSKGQREGTPSVVLPSTPVAFEETPPEAGDPHFRPMSPTTQFAAEILCGLSPLPPAVGSRRGHTSEVYCYSPLGGGGDAKRMSTRKSALGNARCRSWWAYEEVDVKLTPEPLSSTHPRSNKAANDDPLLHSPKQKKPLARQRSSLGADTGSAKVHLGACNHCGGADSPQWRKGPADKPHLCNACGTRFLRTGSLQHSGSRRNFRTSGGAHELPVPTLSADLSPHPPRVSTMQTSMSNQKLQPAGGGDDTTNTPTGREKLQPAGGGDDTTNTPTGREKLQPAGGADDATNTPAGCEKLQPAGGGETSASMIFRKTSSPVFPTLHTGERFHPSSTVQELERMASAPAVAAALTQGPIVSPNARQKVDPNKHFFLSTTPVVC